MKHYLQGIVLGLIIFGGIELSAQNITKLDTLNGFREFKIGNELKIDSSKANCSNFFNEFWDNNYPSQKLGSYTFTCYSPKNVTLGGVKVLNIHVTTFKNKIIRVIVNTEPGEKLGKIVREHFGVSLDCDNFIDSDPIIRRSETCTWKGKDVTLKYCYFTPMKGHVSTKIPEPWMKNGFNSLTYTSKSASDFILSEIQQSLKEAKKDF